MAGRAKERAENGNGRRRKGEKEGRENDRFTVFDFVMAAMASARAG